ncbi:MAG: isoleucine--tRNA ligase [Phycisphaerae bacterium]
MFQPLPARFDFVASEKRILEFWDQHGVFDASLKQRDGSPRFVFYEGPPTANGMPHPGHALTRAMKDIFPRYKTMCGFLVERKAGWDTHGLPVEREVCKELGIRTKHEIEAFGIEKFNLKCIQSVFRYTREWEDMTRRLGFWVNLKDAYVTFHQSYVESVWWSLKTLFERGVLYQGHKVVWWWAQGGTALSAGEVGEGYKKVDDPSVFVKFPLVEGNKGTTAQGNNGALGDLARTSLLVWTTTPWTLLSNHFAAVHPELEYAKVHDENENEYLIVAAALVEAIGKKLKRELTVVGTCKGSDLIGLRYVPPLADVYYNTKPEPTPFDTPFEQGQAELPMGERMSELKAGRVASIGWRVTAADFVTIDSGTGLVHEAPAFGEVDFNLLQEERKRFVNPMALPVLCAVAPDGNFTKDATEKYRGRWVRECDKDIIRELRDERKTPWGTPLLAHQEQYNHDYPYCPQSPDDPLIQYARKGWFVRTTQFKDEFLKNNAAINWLPEHIKEGRFGDFLRNNVDWALSRERYWGTPLPIWVCEQCGKMEAMGSFAELTAKAGATDGGYWDRKVAEHKGEEFPDHLRVHKPYIDEWTYACTCNGTRAGEKGTGNREQGTDNTNAARMRRVTEVIDCWWDAGSMPFAQWGFPHVAGSVEKFAERFPADFISEAIDQTRGWFYGLLSISTMMFGPGAQGSNPKSNPGARGQNPKYPLPYKTCIVLGHMLGEDGIKMSKKLRNFKESSYIFDSYGADAMRWYFYSAQAPWTSVRFQEAAIRETQREFLVKLYNVLSFFTIYASIDGFDPSKVGMVHFAAAGDPGTHSATAGKATPMAWRPTSERGELDRWIATELRRTVVLVRESMDRFENFPAAGALNEFVEALSNWYVRRSRDRFWRPVENAEFRMQNAERASVTAASSAKGDPSAFSIPHSAFSAADQEKFDAYHTLYGCLRSLSVLIAPFTPFFAETMWQTLRVPGDPESVHLCDYMKPEDIRYSNDTLSAEMNIVREIASLGRAARAASTVKEAKKVRQPLSRCEVVLAKPEYADWLEAHRGLIAEELNVKEVEFTHEADQYVSYKVVPNFPAIGKKYRALVPGIKAAVTALADPAVARKTLVATGVLSLTIDGQTVELSPDEVEIRLEAKPGWSAAPGRSGVVVLSTELTPELRDEGLIRELIHFVQVERKEQNLAYEARVTLYLDAPDEFVAVVRRFESLLTSECLASGFNYGPHGSAKAIEVEGVAAQLAVVQV